MSTRNLPPTTQATIFGRIETDEQPARPGRVFLGALAVLGTFLTLYALLVITIGATP